MRYARLLSSTLKEGWAESYPDELGEGVVDVSSTRHEEATARTEVMKEEQFLILWSRADQQRIEVLMTSQVPIM